MRATVAEINVNDLKHNYRRIREIAPDAAMMAIVKANAYGHGMLEIAKILQELGVDFFGVAFADEAARLREQGITQPIVVLFPGAVEEVPIYCNYDLQPVASTKRFISALSKEAERWDTKLKAHLFIDTGMHREGIKVEKLPDFMKFMAEIKNIELIAACTHFATAPDNKDFARSQLKLFLDTIEKLKDEGHEFQYLHAANSAGIGIFPDAHLNIIRPGLSLYGYPPAEDLADVFRVKPIMKLKTKVIVTHRIRRGESVGYSRLFVADRDTTIATLPIGYGDGFSRLQTGKAQCLINGKRYPIVGSICMDACMADLGDDDVKPGDPAVLIGTQGKEQILATDIAKVINTIPYEVTTSIAARVPRVYVEG
jgi:alanine racemase